MTIASKLQELGFHLKSHSVGKYECTCPFCSSQRKAANKKKKVAMVWIEEQFASYNCVHCGEHGYVLDDTGFHKPVKYKRPEVIVRNNLGEKAREFFKNRGISLETAQKLGVYIETKKFSKPMIAYPYYKNGILVNVKYRGIDEKMFMQEKDCEPIFYNYDKCFGLKEIIIVEGENDCLAFNEVGIENVVSIPSGSVAKEVDNENSTKFDFIKNSQPLIDSCDRFILALDNDTAGQAMTQELINRLGRAKCSLVDWSVYDVQGKDANDFLKQDPSILQDAIHNAKPLPMKGIAHCKDLFDDFEDYSINGINGAITTGYHNLDKLINFQFGDFVVVTGYPGCLAGDTEIRIQRKNHGKKIKIEDLYKRFNGLDNHYKWQDGETYVRRCVNGKIGIYPIENVMYSGVKKVFMLELEDGKSIKATAEHKIMTDKGFIELCKLKIGDFVAVDNVSKKSNGRKPRTRKTKEFTVGKLHPYAVYHKIKIGLNSFDSWRVPAHRLIYDAYLNNISIDELKEKTKTDIKGLTFLNPKEYEIHHIDGNPLNNDINNLQALTVKEHHLIHNCVEHFNQGIVEYSKVKSIKELGFEDTYDIECCYIEGNEPNFTANNIIVHNSGKSNFLTNMSMNFAKQDYKVLVYAFENTANQLFKKWFQLLINKPTTNADEQTIIDMRNYYDFIDSHFLIYQDFESLRTIDEIIESAEQAVQQEGCKFIIIDPLNKIPYSKTDNISNDLCTLLNKLTSFCKRNKVVTFLVAHPTKPEKGKLKNVESPSGFDIAGSANFLNMSDVVLTVHRKQSDDGIKGSISKIMISKVRDTDYGHEGSCYFKYNTYTGQYTPCDKSDYDDEKLEGQWDEF